MAKRARKARKVRKARTWEGNVWRVRRDTLASGKLLPEWIPLWYSNATAYVLLTEILPKQKRSKKGAKR